MNPERLDLTEQVAFWISKAPILSQPRDIRKAGILAANGRGSFCEFGVGPGESIRELAWIRPEVPICGFDSFWGLPEDGGRKLWPKGQFSLNGNAPRDLPANVYLYVGLFQETIPRFLTIHPEPAAFLHIDCDLYSSTKTVLELMRSRIVPGTILLFDEFWGFEGWQEASEARAFLESCNLTNADPECLGIQEERALFRVR